MACRITKDCLFLKVTEVHHYSYDDYSDVDTSIEIQYSWTNDEDAAKKFLSKDDAEDFLIKNWKKSFFKDAKIEKCWL